MAALVPKWNEPDLEERDLKRAQGRIAKEEKEEEKRRKKQHAELERARLASQKVAKVWDAWESDMSNNIIACYVLNGRGAPCRIALL